MVGYRRNRVPGARYFFTVTLLDRASRLLVERIADLREVFGAVRAQRPFIMDAVVILPDHLHCVWTLPPNDADYALRWREIKSRFSRRVPVGERRTLGRVNKGERGLWQRRYWEHTLRDERDMARHIDTSITTRSNTAMRRGRRSGRIHRLIDSCAKACIRWIGAEVQGSWRGRLVNELGGAAGEPGFRKQRSTQATLAVPRDGMKIISVGPIRPNQVTNRIESGDFIPLP